VSSRPGLRFLLLLGLFVVAACGCAEPPPAPLRVGVNPWVGYDPLVLAREQGQLDPARVTVVELGSSAHSLRSLRNRALEAAALTLDEVLRLADQGFRLRVVAVLDFSHGADAVLGRAPLEHPADLAGKTIGVEDSAVGAFLLGRALQSAGLQRDSVSVRRLEAADHEPAWRAGEIDALVTYEPMRSQLLRRGARVLFDSRQIPGEIVDVLVVREDVLAERPDDLTALLIAWEFGRTRLDRRDPEALQMLAKGTDLDPAGYRQTLDGLTLLSLSESHAWLQGQDPLLAEKSRAIARELLNMGLIENPVRLAPLIAAEPGARALAVLSGSTGAQP
jgi:NitT/TauT family transport system substrate-binding protein